MCYGAGVRAWLHFGHGFGLGVGRRALLWGEYGYILLMICTVFYKYPCNKRLLDSRSAWEPIPPVSSVVHGTSSSSPVLLSQHPAQHYSGLKFKCKFRPWAENPPAFSRDSRGSSLGCHRIGGRWGMDPAVSKVWCVAGEVWAWPSLALGVRADLGVAMPRSGYGPGCKVRFMT